MAAVAVGSLMLGEWGTSASSVLWTSDALVGLLFMAAPLVVTGPWPLSTPIAVCLASSYVGGVAWLAANRVDLLQFAWRPLVVLAVVCAAGRLNRVSGGVVVALVAQAVVPRTTADPYLALVVCAALVGLAALGADRAHSRARRWLAGGALFATAVAFGGPAVGLIADQPESTASAFSVGNALCLSVAGLFLLAAVRAQANRAEAVEDRVIDLGLATSPSMEAVLRAVPAPSTTRRQKQAHFSGVEAGLALLDENSTLRSVLALQAEEVRLSQVRLLEAADLERARMQTRVTERVEPLLGDVESGLEAVLAGSTPALAEDTRRCLSEIAALRLDLDELSAGLHPRVLAAGGLSAALAALAERGGVRTSVRAPQLRFAPAVERAVWFACAESVANAVKHAAARRVEITVDVADDVVSFAICDDGAGGARVVPSGGLSGLEDRLEALGGGLHVISGPDGTRVSGWMPCAASS